jgi:hypothetical protein
MVAFPLAFSLFPIRGSLVDPLLRALNEHILILRYLQRGQANRPSCSQSPHDKAMVARCAQ